MEKPRYEVKPGPRRGVWCVIDTQTGEVVMRERDEAMIRRYAEARNNLPQSTSPEPTVTATAPAEAPKPAMRAGWSKAAQRRAGRPERSHPFGEVVEAGAGYTIYEDTAFGGGRVQIWDES